MSGSDDDGVDAPLASRSASEAITEWWSRPSPQDAPVLGQLYGRVQR